MVSVLMSAYNGERYIVEQLDSIFAQTMQDFHVYIRDDGSSDGTVHVIEAYIEEHGLQDRITLLCGSNIGFCAGFFELLNKADKGECWAFCDQDDVWLPKKLELALDWMRENDNSKPLLYHSGFQVGNEDLSVRNEYPRSEFDYRFYNSITSNIFFGFSVVINGTLRRMLLQADPSHIKYHDWFAAMITAAFGKYHLSTHIEAVHRQYSHNASPLYFLKKIPHGFRLLAGERFYTKQAREFMRLYGKYLPDGDRRILEWFQMERYSFATACKKAFYKRRWNPQMKVEIVLRVLMLVGVL